MRRADAQFLLLQLCFFVSGFAALLYETAWTRELASVFGTSELAVSAVLAAYMGGLALGAALISRWAPRIRRPILVYGLLELGIAVGALWVPWGIRLLSGIYVSWLGGIEGTPAQVGLLSSLFHLGGTFLALLPCTTLMGATLPLLARHAIREDDEIGPKIGLLYGVNTAGAIAGALAAAFLLLPEYGLRQTIYFGAATNALVFLAAAALSRVSPAPAPTSPDALSASESVSAGWMILPLITLSGMVSFAYEVLWVRLLGFVLGGSTAAFASMLASFLLGIALGSAAASRFARTRARAALGFCLAQLGTAFFAAITFALADWIPVLAEQLGAGVSNLAGGALVSVAALLPTTLCIGATFPFAVRILARNAEDAAPAAARVYAWNTVGSILGSIAAGFFLLPILGFAGTLGIGVMINFGLAAAAVLFLSTGRPYRFLAWVALLGMVLFALVRPGQPLGLITRSTLNGQPSRGELEYLAVGRSATVTLSRTPFARRLATNGLPESSIESPASPPDRFHESRWLSMLPTLARPETSRILVIGLGGGNTLGAVPDSVETIDLIELEPEVVEANRLIGADRLGGDPLVDPRLTLRIGDARGALMLTDHLYDAIISQPSHPWTSGASHLYTREFFGMVKERLEPGGVFVQWMGLGFVDDKLLRGLVGTLSDVFEHLVVLAPGGQLGSGAILFLSSDAPLALLETAETGLGVARDGFARLGAHTVEDIATSIVLEGEAARRFAGASPRITDDHNHLAWSAGRMKQGKLRRNSIEAALAAHDALLSRAGDLNS
nr:fused MFS/spermidine synthase [Myxococcota bacterium]